MDQAIFDNLQKITVGDMLFMPKIPEESRKSDTSPHFRLEKVDEKKARTFYKTAYAKYDGKKAETTQFRKSPPKLSEEDIP